MCFDVYDTLTQPRAVDETFASALIGRVYRADKAKRHHYIMTEGNQSSQHTQYERSRNFVFKSYH